MTTTITDKTLTKDAYVLIGESLSSALIQVKGPDPARIVIATSLPAADVTDGIVLDQNDLSVVAFNDLSATDKIYGIAISGETSVGGFTVAAA